MPSGHTLAPPFEVQRVTIPGTGRAIVYYLQCGPAFSEDFITKHLEISTSEEEQPYLRVQLPATFTNRRYQHRQRLAAGMPTLADLSPPVDEDLEKEKAKRLLYPMNVKSVVFGEAPVQSSSSAESLASGDGAPVK